MPNRNNSRREAQQVDEQTALRLWTQAGGRCSFPGCNEYLLRDNLTQWEIKHGHIAHIVARTLGGPRGNDPLPLSDRSKIGNLILVCRNHHNLIDNQAYVAQLSKELLLEYKRQHEERIYELTACTPDRRSKVIRVRARVNSENVEASYSQICEALFQQNKFPREKEFVDIDFTQYADGEPETFRRFVEDQISAKVRPIYEKNVIHGEVEHISVFAIGSIPMLIYLGTQLSNKIPTTLFQRHRDTEGWGWKDEASGLAYQKRLLREGVNQANVALILSLSGRVVIEQLPATIDGSFFIYEITLQDAAPNAEFLKTVNDLEGFRSIYQSFLSEVRANHPTASTVHLFPAVPAPIAVICGRELLHKVLPNLSIYDNDKTTGGFRLVTEVN